MSRPDAHRAPDGHLVLVDAVNLLPLLQPQLVVAQQPAGASAAGNTHVSREGGAAAAMATTPDVNVNPTHGLSAAAQLRKRNRVQQLVAASPPPHLMRIVHCSSSSNAYSRARCRQVNGEQGIVKTGSFDTQSPVTFHGRDRAGLLHMRGVQLQTYTAPLHGAPLPAHLRQAQSARLQVQPAVLLQQLEVHLPSSYQQVFLGCTGRARGMNEQRRRAISSQTNDSCFPCSCASPRLLPKLLSARASKPPRNCLSCHSCLARPEAP